MSLSYFFTNGFATNRSVLAGQRVQRWPWL